MAKAIFVKNIGGVRWNGYGADIYQNPDLTASIRFDKFAHPLPSKFNLKFPSVDAALDFIEQKKGDTGLDTLRAVLNESAID